MTGMDVIATAGHVDHGKSALVRALTGMEPDRWAEERRRGLTIDLGLRLDDAAVRPAARGRRRARPRALRRQHARRRRLGARRAPRGRGRRRLVGADRRARRRPRRPRGPARAAGGDQGRPRRPGAGARRRPRAAGRRRRWATCRASRSARVTGAGMPELAAALETLLAGLPPADVDAPVRLWIDRAFTIRGAGTVVTGTLAAGTVAAGDRLVLGDREVVVRGVQSLGEPVERASATARVALNLRGVARRGAVPGRRAAHPRRLPRAPTLRRRHARRRARASGCRPSRSCTSGRRPSAHGCGRWTARSSGCGWRPRCRCGSATGCCCAIPGPAACSVPTSATSTRRSCAAGAPPGSGPPSWPRSRRERRGRGRPRPPSGRAGRRLRRHGLAGAGRARRCTARGCWRPGWPTSWPARLPRRRRPRTGRRTRSSPGPPAEVVRRALDLPGRRARWPPSSGRRSCCARGGWSTARPTCPPEVQRAVDGDPCRGWPADPFAAPEAGDLAAAGLGVRELAAAVRSGQLVRIADGDLPGAGDRGGGPGAAGRRRRSRSRSARRGRRGGRAAGSPSRSWSGSTPGVSPSGCPTTPAACPRGPTTIVQLNRHRRGCVDGGCGGPERGGLPWRRPDPQVRRSGAGGPSRGSSSSAWSSCRCC